MEIQKDLLLECFKDIEKLEIIIFDITAELLLYRTFLNEKGLEQEFEKRLTEAQVSTNVKINRFQ